MKQATATRLDSCPKCGSEIEASLKVYLGNVVIERSADTPSPVVSEANDESQHLGYEIEFYGPNDCCSKAISDHLVEHDLWPKHIRAAGFDNVL